MSERFADIQRIVTSALLAAVLGGSLAVPVAPALAANPAPVPPGCIRVHYQRADQAYERWGLWAWDHVKAPSTQWPGGAAAFTGRDSFGAYADLGLTDNARQVGFLIVDRQTGDKEAGNKSLIVSPAQREVYLRQGDDRVYSTPTLQVTAELQAATVVATHTVRVSLTDVQALAAAPAPASFTLQTVTGRSIAVSAVSTNGSDTFMLTAAFAVTDAPLAVSFGGRTVAAPLAWQLIDELSAYDGDDLGCTLRDGQARLALWAPLATGVTVIVFDRADPTLEVVRLPMTRTERGVWRRAVTTADLSAVRSHEPATAVTSAPTASGSPQITDLTGYYYQYEVNNPGRPAKRVLDPYARSMAPVTICPAGQSAGAGQDMIGKAAFVDPDAIGTPPIAAQIPGYAKREDAIIYEVHVRDFTADPAIAGTLTGRWGTFKAFKDRLPYIKALGVTHVQLLPVMAWLFGDETKMHERELHWSTRNCQYNWGYDPQSYFSLDGAYSEQPEDATRRIAEFKGLVDAVHAAGMGVILDVVYTHMAKGSFLDDIVPDYYFFKDAHGNLLGDFGNNLATNRKMAAKLLIDSVTYWFRQYKIDGMRFDMMGDATRDAIQCAYNAAASINPKAIFLGEGWRTFKGHLEDPALAGHGADQDWMAHTDNVGVFSDEFRNELKSGFGSEGQPMFLTGGPRNIEKLFAAIKAQPGNTPTTAPGDMVQYIEAHDNLTLHDVIAQAIKKDPELPENEREIQQRIRIGNAIVLLAQGTAFIHAGQEWGRTKQWRGPGQPEHKYHEFVDAAGKPFQHSYFVHDSYDSSDAINMFDWAKATDSARFPDHALTREFTRGLIALRRASDAFRLGTRALVERNVALIQAPEIKPDDLVIAWRCAGTGSDTYRVLINADAVARTLTLPPADAVAGHDVVVDATRAGTTALPNPAGFTQAGDRITLDPLTVAVFRSR